jgi:hypothetical protein
MSACAHAARRVFHTSPSRQNTQGEAWSYSSTSYMWTNVLSKLTSLKSKEPPKISHTCSFSKCRALPTFYVRLSMLVFQRLSWCMFITNADILWPEGTFKVSHSFLFGTITIKVLCIFETANIKDQLSIFEKEYVTTS